VSLPTINRICGCRKCKLCDGEKKGLQKETAKENRSGKILQVQGCQGSTWGHVRFVRIPQQDQLTSIPTMDKKFNNRTTQLFVGEDLPDIPSAPDAVKSVLKRPQDTVSITPKGVRAAKLPFVAIGGITCRNIPDSFGVGETPYEV
jgi:hypothetical protein